MNFALLWFHKQQLMPLISLIMLITQMLLPIMRSKCGIIKFHFSSKRFMISSDQWNKIPTIPQDLILSRFLKSVPSKKQLQINQKVHRNNQLVMPKKWSYKQTMNQNPYGSIKSFDYKDCELTLMATNYQRSNSLNLIETLIKTDPDVVFVQVRPNRIFQLFKIAQIDNSRVFEFTQIPKNQKGIFSDLKYLDQLILQPQSLQKMALFQDIKQYFQFLLNNRRNRRKQVTYNNHPLYSKLSKSLNSGQLLNGLALAAAIYYAQRYNKSLLIGEMPEQINRQWIVNSNTLMQLKEVLKVINHMIPRYRSLAITPYQLGTLLYPQLFLAKNDTYMATLMQMIISKLNKARLNNLAKGNPKILGMFHLMQNQAVAQVLSHNLKDDYISPMIQSVIPKPPKSSVARNLTQWQIVQKHIILDILFYGQNIVNVPLGNFRTTNRVIDFYLENSQLQKNQELIMQFRQDKIVEYLKLMVDKRKDGRQEMEKQIVRQAIRSNKRTSLI